MGWSGAGDRRFDWDGSLRVARRLWALADSLDGLMGTRIDAAGEALVDWLGAYGEEFRGRIETEASSAATVSDGLRQGAQAWAFQWCDAMNEQNRRLHARAEQQAKDDRNIVEDVWGGIFGHDDLPPAPEPATVPQPPGFWPTRGFARF